MIIIVESLIFIDLVDCRDEPSDGPCIQLYTITTVYFLYKK